MDSSATLTARPKSLLKQLQSAKKQPAPPPPLSSRRTPSFCSSSSSFSPSHNSSSSLESVLYFPAGADDNDDGSRSPYSPLGFSGSGGVPFSWEHLPGIPKKKLNIHQESSMKLLPLPPPTNNNNNNTTSYYKKNKNSLQSIFKRDPFFAAMVECSKGDQEDKFSIRTSSSLFWNNNPPPPRHGRGGGGGSNNKVTTRSMSDRFGFVNLYSSCKNASAISESIIYLPSSSSSSSSRRSRTNYQHLSHRRSL